MTEEIKMKDIMSMFKGTYLKAADIADSQPLKLTMTEVKAESIGDKKETKAILYFTGREQGLVLNKTNSQTIANLYGNNPTKWTGKEVVLVVRIVEFSGNTVPAIRVEAPKADDFVESTDEELDEAFL